MFDMELTPLDREILLDILENSITDLNEEIQHTDRHEYKEMLKKRREVVQRMLHNLQAIQEPGRI